MLQMHVLVVFAPRKSVAVHTHGVLGGNGTRDGAGGIDCSDCSAMVVSPIVSGIAMFGSMSAALYIGTGEHASATAVLPKAAAG
jgi:hypothetical protein